MVSSILNRYVLLYLEQIPTLVLVCPLSEQICTLVSWTDTHTCLSLSLLPLSILSWWTSFCSEFWFNFVAYFELLNAGCDDCLSTLVYWLLVIFVTLLTFEGLNHWINWGLLACGNRNIICCLYVCCYSVELIYTTLSCWKRAVNWCIPCCPEKMSLRMLIRCMLLLGILICRCCNTRCPELDLSLYSLFSCSPSR